MPNDETITGSEVYQKYEERQRQRETLASLMEEQAQVLRSIGQPSQVETINGLREHLLKEDFKVLVLGEFKTGKSTFINALLGAEVLPAYATPTTAIINEVKWGEERKALLYPKDDTHNGSPRPPKEVAVEDLEDYVVIKDLSNAGKEVRESPYQKVELFWPLDLCRNGVEIIDSPGLNEHEIRDKVTQSYLGVTDAVVFVTSSIQPGPSQSEAVQIERLRTAGHEKILFLCNRFHQLPQREQERVKQYALRTFGSLTNLGEAGIFFVDSLEALEARLNNDSSLMIGSGLPPVEASLARFLTEEKGRVKILRPAYELKASTREMRQSISGQENMLKGKLETIEERYRNAQEPLRQVQIQREQIVARVKLVHAETRMRVVELARGFYLGLAEKVEGWIDQYEIQEPLRPGDLRQKNRDSAIERVSTEIAEHVRSKTEPESLEWQQTQLQPLLQETAEELRSELDPQMSEFLRNLDNIRLEVTQGIAPSGVPEKAVGEDISPANRILSAIGGGVIGGAGSAWIGATFGYKEMAKSLIPSVAIAVPLLLVGAGTIVILPALLVAALVQRERVVGRMTKMLKAQIAQEYARQFHDGAEENAKVVADEIANNFGELESALDKSMGEHIRRLREQVESVLDEKRKGQDETERRLKELASGRQRVEEIEEKLDMLIKEVATT